MPSFPVRNVVYVPAQGECRWMTFQFPTDNDLEEMQGAFNVDEFATVDIQSQKDPSKAIVIGKLYYSRLPARNAPKNLLGTELASQNVFGTCYMLSNYNKGETVQLSKEVFETYFRRQCELNGKPMKRVQEYKMPNKAKSSFEIYQQEYVAQAKKRHSENKEETKPVFNTNEAKDMAQKLWNEMNEEAKAVYVKQETDDKVRYDNQVSEYTRLNPAFPKNARSSYAIWAHENGRAPGKKKDADSPDWKTMSDEDKKPYEEKALADKLRHDSEYVEYVKKCEAIGKTPEPKSTPKQKSTSTSQKLDLCLKVMKEHGVELPVKQAVKRKAANPRTRKVAKTETSTVSVAVEQLAEDSDSSSDESDS